MHPEARLHALARQADAGQAPAQQESEKINTEYQCFGSGSARILLS